MNSGDELLDLGARWRRVRAPAERHECEELFLTGGVAAVPAPVFLEHRSRERRQRVTAGVCLNGHLRLTHALLAYKIPVGALEPRSRNCALPRKSARVKVWSGVNA